MDRRRLKVFVVAVYLVYIQICAILGKFYLISNYVYRAHGFLKWALISECIILGLLLFIPFLVELGTKEADKKTFIVALPAKVSWSFANVYVHAILILIFFMFWVEIFLLIAMDAPLWMKFLYFFVGILLRQFLLIISVCPTNVKVTRDTNHNTRN